MWEPLRPGRPRWGRWSPRCNATGSCGYIEQGIAEGAKLIAGGPTPPEGLDRGYFVRPTVFSDATPDMSIVREEIFGPVLVDPGL